MRIDAPPETADELRDEVLNMKLNSTYPDLAVIPMIGGRRGKFRRFGALTSG